AFDPQGNGRQVFRANAGLYYARIPGLNLASTRSTNGSNGLTYFRNSALTGVLGPVPGFGNLLPDAVPASSVFFPDVFVFDKNFQNPRTLNVTLAYERQLAADLGLLLSYTYARTDHLTRFINRNDAVFGSPWSTGLPPAGSNGIGTLTTVESSAFSRYNGYTIGLKRVLDPNFQFQLNYTLSFDKSDDDNERDAQHAAQGQRLLLVGRALLAPVPNRRAEPGRGAGRDLQPDRERQLPRSVLRQSGLQL